MPASTRQVVHSVPQGNWYAGESNCRNCTRSWSTTCPTSRQQHFVTAFGHQAGQCVTSQNRQTFQHILCWKALFSGLLRTFNVEGPRFRCQKKQEESMASQPNGVRNSCRLPRRMDGADRAAPPKPGPLRSLQTLQVDASTWREGLEED